MSVSSAGMLAEQFAADGPKLRLYDSAENHWKDLMNWQHSTMYLFFGLAGAVSLIIHCTEAAPLALDRLMVAVAFFNEGKRRTGLSSLHSDVAFSGFPDSSLHHVPHVFMSIYHDSDII